MSKRFGATLALDNVDLQVEAASVHALVGENGAGKSTLMKVLSGAVLADAGDLWLDGAACRFKDPLEARRAGVAMIYQELSLCPHLTVEENIALGVESGRRGLLNRRVMRERAHRALAQLEHGEIRTDARVDTLAVAQQQLVEIARALAQGCRVLVLDEPTSSLAEDDIQRLFRLIRRLKEENLALIYISHFIEEVKEVADRLTVLRDGRAVAAGVDPGLPTDRIVSMMTGRRLEQMYPRSERKRGESILALDELAGWSKPVFASLTLHRGEVVGIAGLVGAGRTELLRALFGLDRVRRGTLRVGAYLGPATPVMRWKQGVGLLSEDRKAEGLALSMNVADNLTLSKLEGMGPSGLILPARQRQRARRWIDRLTIRCRDPWQPVSELSGGNQQKVALARLLHHDVDLYLLDEPTRGIDVASKAQVYRLIDELASGGASPRPRAVLMVSSYLPELLGVCDRVAVMCRGRLGPARPVAELNEHRLMMEATGQQEA